MVVYFYMLMISLSHAFLGMCAWFDWVPNFSVYAQIFVYGGVFLEYKTHSLVIFSKPLSNIVSSRWSLSRFFDEPLDDPLLYRKDVGASWYLIPTHLEISYAVSKVSQLLKKPTNRHQTVVKRVLQHLKGTITHGLFVNCSSSLAIQTYVDIKLADCPNDR